MHTSGLVVTLADDLILAKAALRQLADAGPFQVGESSGPCRAVVLEASDPKSSEQWHDWAASLPGIENVEVVFIHWDETEAEMADALA